MDNASFQVGIILSSLRRTLQIKILRGRVWGSGPGRRVQLRQGIGSAAAGTAGLQDPAEDNRGVNAAQVSLWL